MKIETDGYSLICEDKEDGLIVTGYEGEDPILDMSGIDGITDIDKKAFLCCRSIRKVILPPGIRHIGDWCFSNCDNLRSVYIDTAPAGSIFGRGVFDGCNRLSKIVFSGRGSESGYEVVPSSGSGQNNGFPVLLAAAVNRLPSEHLLRADDLGQRFWYEKWDISLLSLLGTDNTVNSQGVAIGGEEDISYDGVACVDGEMPGVESDHVRAIAKNKCMLCYLRLHYDDFLSDESRQRIEQYILDRSFGSKEEWAWLTLTEDCSEDMEYIKIYLSIVHPDREIIMNMINTLDQSKVQLKAHLINETKDRVTSAFDELLL